MFVCTDSTEIFSKLRSAGLNYNLPSFFTDSYCAGVSNKHCLLTFFILPVLLNLSYSTLFIFLVNYFGPNCLILTILFGICFFDVLMICFVIFDV